MEQTFFFIIVIFVILLIVGGSIYAAHKRQKELEAVAERVGLLFSSYADDAHVHYDEFKPFGNGGSRNSSNLIHGQRGEIDWHLFDYRYTTGSGKNKHTHHYGIAAAHVPMWFRRLEIRPEGWLDKIAAMVGWDDINFESEQFSRRYHVSCDVRKFAFDVIHPQMIEYLLMCPSRHWQLRGGVILIHKSGRFSPSEIPQLIAMVEGFVQRIPEYVRQDAQLHVPTNGPNPNATMQTARYRAI